MSSRIYTALVGFALLFTLTQYASAQNSFSFIHEPIYQEDKGSASSYNDQNAKFFIQGNNQKTTVTVISGTNKWKISLRTERGSAIKPGYYPVVSAKDYSGYPGINTNLNGSSCSMYDGSLTIQEISFDRDGKVDKFSADFTQHCGRGGTFKNSNLFGALRYHSDMPNDLLNYKMHGSRLHDINIFTYGSVGDYISGGNNDFLKSIVGLYRITTYKGNINIDYNSPNDDWSFRFEAPKDTDFHTGLYTDAIKMPSNGEPGIDISGNGKGCNQDKGNFNIRELTYNRDGTLKSLAIDFVQHCENFYAPLVGAIRYHSLVPIALTRPILINSDTKHIVLPIVYNTDKGEYESINLTVNKIHPIEVTVDSITKLSPAPIIEPFKVIPSRHTGLLVIPSLFVKDIFGTTLDRRLAVGNKTSYPIQVGQTLVVYGESALNN